MSSFFLSSVKLLKLCPRSVRACSYLARPGVMNSGAGLPAMPLSRVSADTARPNSDRAKYFWRLLAGGGACVLLAVAADTSVEAASPTAQRSQLDTRLLLQQADDYYSIGDFEKLYTLLEPHKGSGNDEVLWRLARASYKRAKASKDSTQRGQLLKEAFSYAQDALQINDKNYAVHKWMAILVDEVAALEGSKARIQQSFVMRDHMEKACELSPKDGTSWYLLGMWHFNIADIPWYQRKVAAVVFATPPQSSFEEALKVFLHAEEVEPNFYSQNLLMIGRCYHRLQDRPAAVPYLLRARDYTQPNQTQDDRDAKEEAGKLLKDLGHKE